jgi:hypothetical protein
MASAAQIAANRANAQNSTGPRTEAGKAASSRNALKHGMTAKSYLVFDESWDDFVAFHGLLRHDYEPQGAAEEEIVERIVLAAWCLRRAWRAEAAITNQAALTEAEEDAAAAFPPELLAVTRYQAHHERALNRAIAQLHRLRTERRRDEAARVAARRAAAEATERLRIERRLGLRPEAEAPAAPIAPPAPAMQATKRSQIPNEFAAPAVKPERPPNGEAGRMNGTAYPPPPRPAPPHWSGEGAAGIA